MKSLIKTSLFCLIIAVAFLTDAGKSMPDIRKDEPSRLEEFPIHAPQLRDSERIIQVYLPPDYFESDEHYPVIYLQDGYYLFNPEWIRDCHYDETLDKLFYLGKLEGIIAVDIFASGTNRWDEYSPWVNNTMHLWNEDWSKGGGEGDAYLDFVVDTLKPYIDSHYRTLPERENTGIGGFSMGGLISLYAGLSRPEVFSKVMAVSPAVWFAEVSEPWLSNNQLFNYVKSIDVPKNVTFYIDVGTNEWADNLRPIKDEAGNQITFSYAWISGAEATLTNLKNAGVPANNVVLVIEEGGVHDTPSWDRRFGDAILWLYFNKAVYSNQLIFTLPAVSVTEAVPAEDLENTSEEGILVNSVDHKYNDDQKPANSTLIILGITELTAFIALFLTFKNEKLF